jgi:hypothetical protein
MVRGSSRHGRVVTPPHNLTGGIFRPPPRASPNIVGTDVERRSTARPAGIRVSSGVSAFRLVKRIGKAEESGFTRSRNQPFGPRDQPGLPSWNLPHARNTSRFRRECRCLSVMQRMREMRSAPTALMRMIVRWMLRTPTDVWRPQFGGCEVRHGSGATITSSEFDRCGAASLIPQTALLLRGRITRPRGQQRCGGDDNRQKFLMYR